MTTLEQWLHPRSEIGRELVEKLTNGNGYAVIEGVLSDDEVTAELDRLWGFVETISPSVKREDPSTWYAHPDVNDGEDPWPHTQKDRFQTYQVIKMICFIDFSCETSKVQWIFGATRSCRHPLLFYLENCKP